MISVPIQYRRVERGQFIQKLQHAIPSVVVLGDGVTHLSHDPHGVELVFGVFEVAAAAAVMISVVRGFRQLKKRLSHDHIDHYHGVDWIDIFIGAMLGVEAYAKYHATSHIPRPTILLAITMVAIGVTHGRIAAWGARKRRLDVGPDGISVPGKPFTRLTLKWRDVASIEIGDRWAVVTATDGRSKKIDLSDVRQPQAVRDALLQATIALDNLRRTTGADLQPGSA